MGRSLSPDEAPSSGSAAIPEVDVVIEVARGGFVKRGSSGRVDFISPWPCPFNYGSVPTLLGLDGDLLAAVRQRDRAPGLDPNALATAKARP